MATGIDVQPVTVEGEPQERGRAQGEALRPLISIGMERWKEVIQRSIGLDTDGYLERFIEETDFMPAIERWAPDLLEEVKGIAEGANLPFRDIYAYQLMDEEWFFRFESASRPEHCSTVAVFDEGQTPILGQNMDLPSWYDGTQTLLHVKNQGSDVESFVFAPAGLIGTTGVNNQGIGICCNSIAHLGFRKSGLPVAFIVRRVLEQRSLQAAVDFVGGVEHSSAQNYAIGGPETVVDLECSPNKVVQFVPEGTRLCHTNHPLANDDQPLREESVLSVVFGKGSQPEPAPDAAILFSERRLAFLDREVTDRSERVDVERVKALLSSGEVPISIPRSDRPSMTLGSVVMELSVPSVMHFAPGPPAETPYSRWTF